MAERKTAIDAAVDLIARQNRLSEAFDPDGNCAFIKDAYERLSDMDSDMASWGPKSLVPKFKTAVRALESIVKDSNFKRLDDEI